MPKIEMNYNNTIIYKLICNDLEIKSCYVGHTTNFIKRKYSHKSHCNNKNSKHYNLLVYKTIRENGDWNNWSMIEIEKYNCNDLNEALARERYWIEELKADLNKQVPTRTQKEWFEENKEQKKEWREKYREENKDKLNKKLYEKFECECGGKYIYQNKSIHFKTNKHLDYLNKINSISNI